MKLSTLQTFCLLAKLALMGDLVLELVMFLYELAKLHHLEKQAVSVVVRYSELERRKIFAKKYACRTSMWLCFIALTVTSLMLIVSPVKCRSDQAVEWHSVCQNCQLDNCGLCATSGKQSCDQCASGYFFDSLTMRCEDASCRLQHCLQCDVSGIESCDTCADGFFFNSLIS